MPGIITHYKIFNNSINYLINDKCKNPYTRLIQALFEPPHFKKAALFGSIGPNIFDYLPLKNNSLVYGSELSFILHNEGYKKIISSMINSILACKDHNNEWASVQRAYLYGFISHIIADTIFHPFIFYWSGFTNSKKKRDVTYFRKQHLRFEYNIDQYLWDNADDIADFNLNNFLPVKTSGLLNKLDPAIKYIIMRSLQEHFPKLIKNIFLLKMRDNRNGCYGYNYLDLIPYCIKATYWIKRNGNKKVIDILKYFERKQYLYSDFIIRYPSKNKVYFDGLNFHKARWQYPAGAKGLHYESVFELIDIACEKIIETWKAIEEKLYSEDKDITDVITLLDNNSLTGENNKFYADMYDTDPIRLRY